MPLKNEYTTCSGIYYKSLDDMPLILKIMSLYRYFVKPTIPHINSETNLLPSIINVVCKYLTQCLSTSFGVATLPICCNIE